MGQSGKFADQTRTKGLFIMVIKEFQSVVTPNGLIANIFGPVEGRGHDSGILEMSGLLNQLEQHSFIRDCQLLCIYGDRLRLASVQLERLMLFVPYYAMNF